MTTIAVEERALPPFLTGAPKQLLIGGVFRPAATGETLETVNPATGKVIASVAAAGSADVDAAVAAARQAFEDPSWSAMNPHERTRWLLRIADTIESHLDELAELDSLDNGTPFHLMKFFISGAVDVFRYYAGWPTKILGSVTPSDPSVLSYTLREPVGVCAGIIPWNGPLTMAAWKMAPALACGNTFILKPAEQTPLSAVRFGELLLELGLPDGVVNILSGHGESAGAALTAHPGVDKVSFTGSTEVGKKVLAASVGNLKRVTLELGGKSPHIVFADADVRVAAATAASGFCTLSGQVCFAGTRLLVQREVHDEFVAALAEEVANFRLGDPFAATTTMGPLVSAEQFARVTSYVDVGVEQGGTLKAGGERLDNDGYFVQPTVFDDVSNDMRIFQEEIFGPVAAVVAFTDEADAVRIANDTQYGLAAAIATKDVGRAHKLARQIKSGVIWVNTYGELDPAFSFGGFKQSGTGRELGAESIDAYTETKSVFTRL